MDIYMNDEFISVVKSLIKSKDHSDCENVLINSVYSADINQIKSGALKLGGSNDTPFLRKRIKTANKGASSGYRLYFWLFIKDDDIYLLYIHPKTGKNQQSNISTDKRKELVKTFKNCRDNELFIQTELSKKKDKIVYRNTENHIF